MILFAGSDGGGHRWAVLRSLIETCKLKDIEPYAYLCDVLTRMVDGYPITVSAYCCRGRGKPEILSRAERSARPGRLRRRLPTGLIQSPNERQSLPERDGMRFCLLGTIPAGEMHEKTLRLGRERREIDDATDAWQPIRLHFGGRQFRVRRGLRVGRTALREPTRSDRKRRRFGRRSFGRRSLVRALRYGPASLAAAAGRSPNARRSGRGPHCKRPGTLASRSGRAAREDRRRQRECCRADCKRQGRDGGGPAIRHMSLHDPHQPHCALWRNGARISSGSRRASPPKFARDTEFLRGLRDESCEGTRDARACRASDRSRFPRAPNRRTAPRSKRRTSRRRSSYGLTANALAHSLGRGR